MERIQSVGDILHGRARVRQRSLPASAPCKQEGRLMAAYQAGSAGRPGWAASKQLSSAKLHSAGTC